MKSSQQKKIRRENEAQFYEPTKEALTKLFKRKKYCHLEITADRQLSETIKQVLSDYNLFANIVERFIPDITGYVEEDESKHLIVVEVKPGPPRLKDIFQTKEYAEIFGAKHAFLVSPKLPQEEIRRILSMKGEILSHSVGTGRVSIGHLNRGIQASEWQIETWYPDTPSI